MSDRINHTMAQSIVEDPEQARKLRAAVPDLAMTGARVFYMGDVRIVATVEDGLCHMSASCADRDPTYDELVTLRYALYGRVRMMAMLFPPLEDFVNMHPHTFHLYELSVQKG